MGKIPEETLDGAKTDTDSEFVTISETTENVFAEVPTEMKQGKDINSALKNLYMT